MKKHIIIATSEFPPQPGGIGNHAYNLALYLSKSDYEVSVITDQRSSDGQPESDFDNRLPFSVIRIEIKKWRLIMYIKRLVTTFKYLKKSDYIIATGKFSLWNVSFCNTFFKRQSLAVIHGSEVNFKPILLRKSIDLSLKQFSNIIAVSNYTKRLVSHLNRDVEVIPNGIDLKIWHNNSQEFTIIGTPILTTVGRVSTRKGQLNVIKQLPMLIQYFPKIHYHCIGIPTEADAFIKVAKDLNVSNHITFHGTLDDNILKLILSNTDIFVMLSTESKTGDVEGFGIAILEANALSVPAIGTKGCGIEDAINPNVSGVLIDIEDKNSFKKSVKKILEAKTKFKSGARLWAESHDWVHIVKRYIEVLK